MFPGYSSAARRLNRRQFLAVMGAAGLAAAVPGAPGQSAAPRRGGPTGGRGKRIALLATEVRKHSHGQHFIDRFLEGYGWQGRHYRPQVALEALYVDQFPENDLSRDRARRHPVRIYPTIAEALTLGGSNLAVDGVVIIAEHGRYPRTDAGQTRYPRYAFFKQVIDVFERSGRSVPVFNDKHLSTEWTEALEMVEDSRRLGFAFLAGSSLPVTWRIPALELPLGCRLGESVCVCYGGVDSYDFHGLETAQCMSERRAGGEAGVRSVLAVRGAKLWEELAEREGARDLMLAALARSHLSRAPAGYTFAAPGLSWVRECCPEAVGYFIEHEDGFRTAMFLLNGLVQDFTYAGRMQSGETVSCQMHLPMPTRISTTADFFNPLVYQIERTILTRRASYPVERTLLTTGMTLFAVQSLFRGGTRIETPEMKVAYRAPRPSTFWRA